MYYYVLGTVCRQPPLNATSLMNETEAELRPHIGKPALRTGEGALDGVGSRGSGEGADISGLARCPRGQIDHLAGLRPLIRGFERFTQRIEFLVRDSVQPHLQIQLRDCEHMGRTIDPEPAKYVNMIVNRGEDCLQALGHVLCHRKDPAAGARDGWPQWQMMFR
jgi:hypothetical protein